MEKSEFITNYLSEMSHIASSISVADIERIVDILFEAWENGKQVFACGNGGSASTASHFACDLAKATIVNGRKRFNALCLNDNIPLMSALINDDGFDNLFYEQLRPRFGEKDVLVCFSVHGGAGKDNAGLWSQNLLKAMQYARDKGGRTIGFSGFDGGPMKDIADACVVVPVDSTPHVESFHLALEHLICSCLKHRIESVE